MQTVLSILLLALSLTACITPSIRNWPETVPSQRLFIQAYRDDVQNQAFQSEQAYLEWILGFYQGTLIYPTGWLDVEEQLIAITPPEHRDELDSRLEELGILIGAEWAKENEARLIDNRMLALWGSVLQLSLAENKELQAVDFIASDVERILAGEIQKEDVVELRYADALGYELFDDFGDF